MNHLTALNIIPKGNISRKDMGMLFMLFITEYVRGAFFFNFLPVYVVNELNLSVALAGIAISSHFLTETIFKTTAGWHLDRLGRPILLGGLIIGFFTLLLMKNYPTPAVLIGASALFGLGASPIWLGVISEVAPVGIENRARKIGFVFTAWLAGAGSGLVSINFFMSRDYNLAFWFIITLWFLSFTAALFLVPSRSRRSARLENSKGITPTLKKILSNRAVVRVLMPGMFLQTLAAGLLVPLLPLYAQSHLGLNYNQYALLLLAGGSTALFFMLPMGMLADRVTLKGLLTAGFTLSGISLGLLSFSTSVIHAFIWAGILGLSYAVVLPAWNSLLAKTIPAENQATGWGIFCTIEGLGVAIGPALGGIAARGLGMGTAILIPTMVLLAMALFYFLFPLEKLFSK